MADQATVSKNTYAKGDRYYGKAAERYERKRKKQDWWHVEHEEMGRLLDQLPKGLKVVDIPFGTGRFVPLYRERGYTIAGLDASHEMLGAAERALGSEAFAACETTTGNAMALPYSDGEFDLLVSTRFLRDIILFEDAKKALAEFARVSRTYLILQLGEAIEGGRVPDGDEVWHSSMSADMNRELLSSHGLEIEEKRLVKEEADINSRIHHVLCRKVG